FSDLNDYYPYRAVLQILYRVAADLSSRLSQPCLLGEFWAGSLRKVESLFNLLVRSREYYPPDIFGSHLCFSSTVSPVRLSWLSFSPLVADFCKPVTIDNGHCQCLGFFPGSTIGNFAPEEAQQFLQNAKRSLGEGGHLIIGVDTKKNPSVIHRAYNDPSGVTA